MAVIISCLLLCLLYLSVPVSAANEGKNVTLSFGDSIAQGYGLEGYQVYGDAPVEGSYLYLWSQEHGELNTNQVKSYAKSGFTSQQILNTVRDADEQFLKNATEIFISAGGNDVMSCYGQMIFRVMSENPELLSEYASMPEMSGNTSIQQTIFSFLFSPAKQKLTQKLSALCTGEEAQKKYDAAVSDYQENLKNMIRRIRETNKTAEIVILPPYNPLKALTMESSLSASVDKTIALMDRTAQALLKDNEVNEKLHVISLLTAFEGQYHELTNVDRFDIHPGKQGHAEIYRLIKEELEPVAAVKNELADNEAAQDTKTISASENLSSLVPAQEEAPSAVTNIPPAETSQVISPVVTWILFGAACGCVAAIIVVFIVRRVKNKKTGK